MASLTSPAKETTMPRAEILSKQALHTLTQLHAELAGKIETNRKSGDKLRSQMVQVEAVMKMLNPEFNARAISAKRRTRAIRGLSGALYIGAPWTAEGHDGAADIGCAAGRKDSHGHPEAGGSHTGSTPCCAAGAEWENGGWRWLACAVEVEEAAN